MFLRNSSMSIFFTVTLIFIITMLIACAPVEYEVTTDVDPAGAGVILPVAENIKKVKMWALQPSRESSINWFMIYTGRMTALLEWVTTQLRI